MKFGVRECADVVFRAKTAQKIGKKIFYKNEPVIYFDTLKTSSLEGAATTVYAQGGRGNPRLMSWDGERTVTFTMEDALISPVGLAILSGAGLIDAEELNEGVIQHLTEQTDKTDGTYIYVKEEPYKADGSQDTIYVMKLNSHGEVDSEPILYAYLDSAAVAAGKYKGLFRLTKKASPYAADSDHNIEENETVLVDYYTAHASKSMEINITPDKFGGAFYMEAATLWRDQGTQKDYPAEFIIPNLRVQSNFTFTMASSGDPSSFTFTCDAFPDYTRFDKTKKVLAQIQIIGASTEEENELSRIKTKSTDTYDETNDLIKRDTTEITNNIYAITNTVQIVPSDGSLNVSDLFETTIADGSSEPTITYQSSNAEVAEVNVSTGIVTPATGVTTGIAEIIATAQFGATASQSDPKATIVVKIQNVG